ncbi:hypothetical protein ACFSZS_13555 [Seohaeicola zhoushanensis]
MKHFLRSTFLAPAIAAAMIGTAIPALAETVVRYTPRPSPRRSTRWSTGC